MILLAIDPGPVQSAYVLSHGDKILCFGKLPNADVISGLPEDMWTTPPEHLAIERIVSRGIMPNDAVMTAEWVGRFIQAFAGIDESKYTAIPRSKILGHFCGQYGNDSRIRDAMIARYGGTGVALDKGGKCPMCKGKKGKREQCAGCEGSGLEHERGPLVGVTGDCLAALAVGCFWWDCCKEKIGAANGQI